MADAKFIDRLSVSLCTPYVVYLNGVAVGSHDNENDAFRQCENLRHEMMTPQQRQRERDRVRTVMQTPISTPRYRVMYLVNGRERKSAWLYDHDRATQGLRLMQSKYGERNAIIYQD